MPLWRLYYHVVWSTLYREHRLDEEVETLAHEVLRHKIGQLDASVFAVNGMTDHIHVIASIPPKLSVSQFVGQIKGYSSNRLNQSGLLDRPFAWQDEYATFSFDAKRLLYHVAYVENQKIHHGRATLIPALERTGEDES
jgi:putative transposase